MSTTSNAITGMRTANEAIIETSNNIANSQTPGFKSSFTHLANIAGDNGVYGQEGNTIDLKGSLEHTGLVTDLATSNNKGFFIVKNKLSDEVVNVITGSFKPNVKGELEYLNKYLLLGEKFHDDSSLPSFNLERLEPVVIDSNITSKAVATTSVTENFNLNSALLAKGQASFIMKSDANSSTDALPSSDVLQSGNGFSIQIQEEHNGQVVSNTVKCIFFWRSKIC